MQAFQLDDEIATANDFAAKLSAHGLASLRRGAVTTLQVNVGLRCNLACRHCHVESGPKRTERLSTADCRRVIELLEKTPEVDTLDLTGGAPELHPEFRALVSAARSLGRHVVDRCNLTVFDEPGQHDTPEFLADNGVEVVASLPCYDAENVEHQRGRGVFDRSIGALRRLNALGYGRGDPSRPLALVYNPVGATLPPSQAELEQEYATELAERFGLRFDRLVTITNMPIKRFAQALARAGQYDDYMTLLVEHFNPATVPGLMCRSMVSVDHQGRIFDCDFNQALELAPPRRPRTIWSVDRLSELSGTEIATASHCFGCTAGAGSSCGGALT